MTLNDAPIAETSRPSQSISNAGITALAPVSNRARTDVDAGPLVRRADFVACVDACVDRLARDADLSQSSLDHVSLDHWSLTKSSDWSSASDASELTDLQNFLRVGGILDDGVSIDLALFDAVILTAAQRSACAARAGQTQQLRAARQLAEFIYAWSAGKICPSDSR